MDVVNRNSEETYLEVIERQLYSKISGLVEQNRYRDAREVAELLEALKIV